MAVERKYLKKKPVCRVSFVISKEVAGEAEQVCVVGDFNDWDTQALPMKKMRGGAFKVTLDLAPQAEYQFRYLINGEVWENEPEADKFLPNPFGGDNSVVVV